MIRQPGKAVEFSAEIYGGHDRVRPAPAYFMGEYDWMFKIAGHCRKVFMGRSEWSVPLLEDGRRQPGRNLLRAGRDLPVACVRAQQCVRQPGG